MGAPKGNTNSAGRGEFRNALRKALANHGKSRLPKIMESLLNAAESGEAWAIKEIAERLDGKAPQAVSLTGADEGPLKISWER